MHPPDPGDFGRPLTEAEAAELLRCICFKTGPPRTVGVELEWLVHEQHDPRRHVPAGRLEQAHRRVRALPLNSAVTVEPGGQLELSSAPAASLMECVTDVQADLRAVRTALAADGLTLSGTGLDPWQPPRRILRHPRYDAMEAFLDDSGPCGRVMMCSSASIQVCLDAGEEEPGPLGHGRRWQLAHLLGAVLTAVFANSPVLSGRRTGWRSTRQAIWAELDPVRPLSPPLDREPRAAWADHVLDAPVMCVRTAEGPWTRPSGITFRQWLRSGDPRPPSREDLEYHLTTLFPPVRPRGHLELRMIDAQQGDDWVVPLAVTTALFDDPEAAETIYRAVKPLAERAGSAPAPRNPLWLDAARLGPSDPEIGAAAVTAFSLALEALPRLGATREVTDTVAAYFETHVVRGRCPADGPRPAPGVRRPAAPAGHREKPAGHPGKETAP
jgi:glutamate--cysteine ligase